MAKKKLGYVELAWTCPSCKAENPGAARTCAQCGAAMPQGQSFHLPGQQVLDTTTETAARVAAGPDILCPFCGTRNPGNAQVCSQCSGPLGDGSRRQAGEVVGAFDAGPGQPRTCPACGTENPASATQCSQCGASLASAPPPAPAPPAPAPPKRKLGCLVVGVIVALLALCGLFYFLQRPEQAIVAEVDSVQWSYTLQVQQLTNVERQAWHDEVPSGARVVSCTDRVRRTVDEPVAGAIERCGTPYVVDTGTGKGQVQQDCVYDIQEDWCRYEATEWRSGPPIVARGVDLRPYWPTATFAEGQREAGRKEAYRVDFDDDGRQYTYYTDSLTEYQRFTPGSRWEITTNALGNVTAVRPAQ
jgi:ribosomal protein L40E